jgi:outer membrane protein
MKRLIGIAALTIIMAVVGQNSMAQNLKFGHINSDQLIQSLPEFDSATVKLQKFQKELINALELMQVELNTKNDAYLKDSKNLSDIVKQTKEQELTDMDRRIREFQTTAQTQLQDKQAELFQPIVAKVNKAISDVGKENGFVYVFNTGQGTPLLFFDEAKSTNLMPLAKAKLGLK